MNADQLFTEITKKVHRLEVGRDNGLASVVWDDFANKTRRYALGHTLTEALSKALTIIDPGVDQS